MPLPFTWLRALSRLVIGRVGRRLHGRTAERNLITAFGRGLSQGQRRSVLSAVFTNLADLPAEVLVVSRRGEDFLRSRFLPGPGIDKWRDLQGRNRVGVIGLTGHVGNWELLVQYLHVAGLRRVGGVIAKRLTNPGLNRLLENSRGCFGVPTLYGDSDSRSLLRVLHRGETLGMVPDQDVKRLGGTFVDWFGRPAYTPTGPARLAIATGASLVVAFAKRTGDHLELIVNDPIEPELGAPRGVEVVRLTREWSLQIEAFVRAHPEQWMWFHDRWRTTVDDVARRCAP